MPIPKNIHISLRRILKSLRLYKSRKIKRNIAVSVERTAMMDMLFIPIWRSGVVKSPTQPHKAPANKTRTKLKRFLLKNDNIILLHFFGSVDFQKLQYVGDNRLYGYAKVKSCLHKIFRFALNSAGVVKTVEKCGKVIGVAGN